MDTLWIAFEHLARTTFSAPVAGVVESEGEGQYLDAFGILGVFSTREGAAAACSAWNHGIGPVTLDQAIPAGPQEWPGVEWPLADRHND